MKVAIASSGLGHVMRGVEAWASDLGQALAERGVPILLCKGGGRPEADYERVIPCWRREEPRTVKLASWMPRSAWHLGLGSTYQIEATTFAMGMIRLLRREPVDLIHLQDPPAATILQWAAKRGLIRGRVVFGHGTEEEPAYLKRFDYLHQVAPYHLEQVRAAGVCKPSWRTIPYFIDTDRFHPGKGTAIREELGLPPGALVVLCAAAIKRWHKRVDAVIDEFARLRDAHPDLPAWLVVAGGWETETDELIAEGRARLGDRVRFLVRFPRDRMAELHRAADVFVLGSLYEMMGIVLIEALASGVPCIVNRNPVLEWVIGPGGTAVDLTTPGTLAAALADLLGDTERRHRLGEMGREYCLANFSRDRVVDQTLAYYQILLSS